MAKFISHKRRYKDGKQCRFLTKKMARTLGFLPINMLSKGGETEVEIDGCIGVAKCSNADNFSRRLGVKIATGRALKELNNKQKEDFKNDN